MQVNWSHTLMVRWRVMFCEVISVIVLSLLPMDSKLLLVDAVLDPVGTHIHGLNLVLLLANPLAVELSLRTWSSIDVVE
jgi:hypothetical protein